VKDEEYLAKGAYKTYTGRKPALFADGALNMYEEVDTGTNLPAQIDIMRRKAWIINFSSSPRRRFGQ